MSESTVNDVITDSVTQNNTLLTGIAAPQGMALVDIASAETMGMAMHNAISAQQNAQLTTNASVTATCARMLAITPPMPAPPAVAEKDPPPPFMPLSGNGGEAPAKADASQLLSMANTLAESAAKELKDQNVADEGTKKAIQDLITKLQGLEAGSDKKPVDPKPAPKPADPKPAPKPADPKPDPGGNHG